ncbi:unnamed protein product [Rhizophagus irregularis]|nr:unnamed protein product [Rhizophagus irregularis]
MKSQTYHRNKSHCFPSVSTTVTWDKSPDPIVVNAYQSFTLHLWWSSRTGQIPDIHMYNIFRCSYIINHRVDKKCFTLMSVNQITYPVADEVGIRYKELVVRPLQYAYLYYISVLNIALETILKKVNSEDYIEILLTWITAPQNKETRY